MPLLQGRTRFKWAIKHHTKWAFGLAQNSTGLCSLTLPPPSNCLPERPPAPQGLWDSCHQLLPSGCLPPGVWKGLEIKQPSLSSSPDLSEHQWGTAWSGGGLAPQLGPLVGHGKSQAQPPLATLAHSWLPERLTDKAWNGQRRSSGLPRPGKQTQSQHLFSGSGPTPAPEKPQSAAERAAFWLMASAWVHVIPTCLGSTLLPGPQKVSAEAAPTDLPPSDMLGPDQSLYMGS